jgi:hypothetical protein
MRDECTDSSRHRETESVLLSGDRGLRIFKRVKIVVTSKEIQVGIECK